MRLWMKFVRLSSVRVSLLPNLLSRAYTFTPGVFEPLRLRRFVLKVIFSFTSTVMSLRFICGGFLKRKSVSVLPRPTGVFGAGLPVLGLQTEFLWEEGFGWSWDPFLEETCCTCLRTRSISSSSARLFFLSSR